MWYLIALPVLYRTLFSVVLPLSLAKYKTLLCNVKSSPVLVHLVDSAEICCYGLFTANTEKISLLIQRLEQKGMGRGSFPPHLCNSTVQQTWKCKSSAFIPETAAFLSGHILFCVTCGGISICSSGRSSFLLFAPKGLFKMEGGLLKTLNTLMKIFRLAAIATSSLYR